MNSTTAWCQRLHDNKYSFFLRCETFHSTVIMYHTTTEDRSAVADATGHIIVELKSTAEFRLRLYKCRLRLNGHTHKVDIELSWRGLTIRYSTYAKFLRFLKFTVCRESVLEKKIFLNFMFNFAIFVARKGHSPWIPLNTACIWYDSFLASP